MGQKLYSTPSGRAVRVDRPRSGARPRRTDGRDSFGVSSVSTSRSRGLVRALRPALSSVCDRVSRRARAIPRIRLTLSVARVTEFAPIPKFLDVVGSFARPSAAWPAAPRVRGRCVPPPARAARGAGGGPCARARRRAKILSNSVLDRYTAHHPLHLNTSFASDRVCLLGIGP